MSESLPGGQHSGVLFLAAALALLAFYSVGAVFLNGFVLDLGSLDFPTQGYVTFVAFWAVFGGLCAVLLALALSRLIASPRQIQKLTAEWHSVSERRFLIWTCAAALAIPLSLRIWVLHGAPLTDDESAYRFGAELLASGRLWVPSPDLKLFFDQNFMINDGRLYPAYFLGWPALLAVGVWIHAPGIINPLLSALTVPPLFGVLRHFAGPSWARGGVLLFLSAPFIQIAAATELSHTSCLMALTWCLFMYLRSRGDNSSPLHHAGFAFWFALAFCIRPQSALPIGLPLLISWGLGLRRLEPGQRRRFVLAFLAPASTLAGLFFGALWLQNGSPWRISPVSYAQYLVDNGFRFTTFSARDLTPLPGFDFTQLFPAIARTAVGMFRLNFDLFGWPCSFAFLVFALQGNLDRARVLWGMIGSYLLLLLFQRDWGVDTFGPMHAFELSLPIVILTIAGARYLGERVARTRSEESQPQWPRAPLLAPSLLAAMVITAWLGFVPIRLEAVRQIAAQINLALRAPEREGIHRAVIFAPFPFVPPCSVPRHFVFFRPANDPDLRNDVLWVNDLGTEENRHLLETLPGRAGYILRWTPKCEVALVPLAG